MLATRQQQPRRDLTESDFQRIPGGKTKRKGKKKTKTNGRLHHWEEKHRGRFRAVEPKTTRGLKFKKQTALLFVRPAAPE